MKQRSKTSNGGNGTGKSKGKYTPLAKQPQSKTDAAVKGGIFLRTDDKWSQRYFDPNDLHFEERQVFG